MTNTNSTIYINGVEYTFKETFDVNLTLSYENETWGIWHILREFISNALDSVALDTDKVQIFEDSGYVIIHDQGNGYPIVLAKRIGASSKKNDPASIGQFGEGSKLAMLTCIRKGIKIMLSSQNWLIAPKVSEVEGQEVLMYDIYETTSTVVGSIVTVEATPEVLEIIGHLDEYFLYYNKNTCLFGNVSEGIYPLSDGKAKLFNKGVYIRDIDAIFSYAISIEKLNRDRDLINHSDIAYEIRDIWENVNDKDLIKRLLSACTLPSNHRNRLIEFYCSMYSKHTLKWAEAFHVLYGQNACLFTDEIAEREAVCLGYNVVKIEYSFANILKSGGVKFDKDGLSDDFEFIFTSTLDRDEKMTLFKLPVLAQLAGFDVPESIKVFDEYKQHSDIPGLYNSEKQQIYLRKDLLKSNFEEALYVFLHEACHHSTGADDISREFAEGLCRKLTSMLLRYTNEIGIDKDLKLNSKGIELPNSFSLSAEEMCATVAIIDNELTIKAAGKTLRTNLPGRLEKTSIWNKKILLYNSKFTVPLPDSVMETIKTVPSLSFKVR